MPKVKSDLSILLQVLVWLLIATLFYSVLRLEFLLWNWTNWFQSIKELPFLLVFLQGLRFDLSSISWLSSLILIGALLPWPFIPLKLKERSLKLIFLLIHVPFLLFNMVDLEFIHFAGRRMTPDSFYLMSESGDKVGGLWSTYWPMILLNLILLFAFTWLIKKINIQMDSQSKISLSFKKWPQRAGISLGILIVFIVAARGGAQKKPLETAHAAALSSDVRVTHLVLNSSFTTIHALKKKRTTRLDYFKNREDLIAGLNASTPGQTVMPWVHKPKNVVLFILESFGLEYTGLDQKGHQSFTPFLDSLRSKSLYYENAYANGRRSIEALPSLLAGIPSLLDEPFLTSHFQTNDIPRIGEALEAKGVWTGFFHGGANGTMFFQEFTQRIGIPHYFGKNEYPEGKDFDGTWGIWDGPFLDYFGDKLNQLHQPFFVSLFTLSSHHPFAVPEAYQKDLPEGPLPILKSVAYTDKMLAEFFAKYEKAPWFKETLFIFTADHTSKSYLPEYQTPLMSFRIPMILYDPGSELSAEAKSLDLQEPVQHADIFPTLQQIFELPTEGFKMGRSLLKTGPRKVNLYLDGQEFVVEKNNQLLLPTEGPLPETENPLFSDWKAHRQYYINSLIENRL